MSQGLFLRESSRTHLSVIGSHRSTSVKAYCVFSSFSTNFAVACMINYQIHSNEHDRSKGQVYRLPWKLGNARSNLQGSEEVSPRKARSFHVRKWKRLFHLASGRWITHLGIRLLGRLCSALWPVTASEDTKCFQLLMNMSLWVSNSWLGYLILLRFSLWPILTHVATIKWDQKGPRASPAFLEPLSAGSVTWGYSDLLTPWRGS